MDEHLSTNDINFQLYVNVTNHSIIYSNSQAFKQLQLLPLVPILQLKPLTPMRPFHSIVSHPLQSKTLQLAPMATIELNCLQWLQLTTIFQ